MGKWTPNYVDDVLHGKVSNMVAGSIRRASVEKEPSISYENFVHDLDTGDSFTSTIIDILVKELADRRTRTIPSDRSLISDRTSKSLRRLANAGRTYPINGSFGVPRQPRYATNAAMSTLDALMVNSPDMDDEDFENMQDSEEATRMSHASNLYDAFASSPWTHSATRRISPSPPVPEWAAPHVTASLPRPWVSNSPPTIGANLSRQASVRRAIRTRMDVLTDRRRPYSRDLVGNLRTDPPEGPTEHRENPPRTAQAVRRFFPRSHRNETTLWSEHAAMGGAEFDDQSPPYSMSLAEWHADYDPVRPSLDAEDPAETERLLRAPRIPRPQLSLPVRTQPTLESFFTPHVPAVSSGASFTETHPPEEGPSVPPPDEIAGYPTPGSIENENIS